MKIKFYENNMKKVSIYLLLFAIKETRLAN